MMKYETMADEHLIRELHNGNTEIMDYLLAKYKPMVRKKARAMFLLGGENEDLIQEGMIGLMKAVRTFDASQGAGFAAFARLCLALTPLTSVKTP